MSIFTKGGAGSVYTLSRFYVSGATSIPATTMTTVNIPTLDGSNDANITYAGAGEFIINDAGIYTIAIQLAFAAHATGYRSIQLLNFGSGVVLGREVKMTVTTAGIATYLSRNVAGLVIAASTSVKVQANQTSGVALGIVSGQYNSYVTFERFK